MIKIDNEDFEKIIEKIKIALGKKNIYSLNWYVIILNVSYPKYDFYDGTKWYKDISVDDFKPIENCFVRNFRSVKLKKLLE